MCFPHAGGAAGYYRPLAAALQEHAADVEVLAVQYPGRQDRYGEPAVARVEDVVDAVLGELTPALLADGRPFGLFGHSMGAVLAFETARRLERDDRSPAALFASARQGPSWTWPDPPAAGPHELSDETLVGELRLLGGTDDALLAHSELLELSLSALRGDYRLLRGYTYRPGRLLDCPVITLVGDADPRVPTDDMKDWEQETRGAYASHVLPGGHFYVDDRLAEVAGIVRAGLRL